MKSGGYIIRVKSVQRREYGVNSPELRGVGGYRWRMEIAIMNSLGKPRP